MQKLPLFHERREALISLNETLDFYKENATAAEIALIETVSKIAKRIREIEIYNEADSQLSTLNSCKAETRLNRVKNFLFCLWVSKSKQP